VAAAGPSDACILIWLTTVACEKITSFMPKDDSGLQVLFRRRSELTERLAGEIDDRTFREPDPSEFDPERDEIERGQQIYLSTFEAALMDCALASREPSHPWLTYEEANKLFSEQAIQARADRDFVQRRLRLSLAGETGLLALITSIAMWLLLRKAHISDSVANPAAAALTSTLLMPAVRFANGVRNKFLYESVGIFFASLALLATAVAVNGTLHNPYISDVNGLTAGTLIAVAAAVVWGVFRRSE
jgi:hypothetical protein